ncbi:MAG: transcription antitermination factor NusB [Anaerolineae bacterium]
MKDRSVKITRPKSLELYTDSDDAPIPVKDDRTLARQIALQALYEIDCTAHDPLQVIDIHQRAQNPNKRASRYFRMLVLGTHKHHEASDHAIRVYAPEYPLDQIAIIDRNILRMAIYEFAVSGMTPMGAAIDEAVELAKQFGADGSPAFINGVLGSLADDADMLNTLRQPDEADPSVDEETSHDDTL